MPGYWKKWFIEHRAGTDLYFLSKDIHFKGKRRRIRIPWKGQPPDISDLEHIVLSRIDEVLEKAQRARISLTSDYYALEYIPIELTQTLEEIAVAVQFMLDFLPLHEQEIYKQRFGMRYIHGTTSIEGNTLSLQQVRDLIEFDEIPQAKSKREVFEVNNFERVLEYRNAYKGKVTLPFIKKLHELIIRETGEAQPGSFRQHDRIMIVGYDSPLCPSILIEEELQKGIDTYYTKVRNKYHPFEQAALFHLHFETIHPFDDGNGRVGREIFNYMITKEGYSPMLFLGEERETYISALNAGNNTKYGNMVGKFMEMYISLYHSVARDLEK
jgi:Fic family protein